MKTQESRMDKLSKEFTIATDEFNKGLLASKTKTMIGRLDGIVQTNQTPSFSNKKGIELLESLGINTTNIKKATIHIDMDKPIEVHCEFLATTKNI